MDTSRGSLKPSLRFLYLYCLDLKAMRRFYSDLLQLEETFYDEESSLAYRCDSLQFTIFQVANPLPAPGDWAQQPGWSGGTLPCISWSVECSGEAFKEVVARLQGAGVRSFQAQPRWVGYWSYPVQDPVGNTVEITCPQSKI